jgi:hypothetical protein
LVTRSSADRWLKSERPGDMSQTRVLVFGGRIHPARSAGTETGGRVSSQAGGDRVLGRPAARRGGDANPMPGRSAASQLRPWNNCGSGRRGRGPACRVSLSGARHENSLSVHAQLNRHDFVNPGVGKTWQVA